MDGEERHYERGSKGGADWTAWRCILHRRQWAADLLEGVSEEAVRRRGIPEGSIRRFMPAYGCLIRHLPNPLREAFGVTHNNKDS